MRHEEHMERIQKQQMHKNFEWKTGQEDNLIRKGSLYNQDVEMSTIYLSVVYLTTPPAVQATQGRMMINE